MFVTVRVSLKFPISTKIKAYMESYIPLETAAIFFLANFFLKQGISSGYAMVDFICMGILGLQGAKAENYKSEKLLPVAGLELRPLNHKCSA